MSEVRPEVLDSRKNRTVLVAYVAGPKYSRRSIAAAVGDYPSNDGDVTI